jgi:hypothetical protein
MEIETNSKGEGISEFLFLNINPLSPITQSIDDTISKT